MTTTESTPRMVWLNGAYVAAEDARVSVDDRGFLFGDGAYEVVRVVRGVPFEMDRHLRRLERTLREIGAVFTGAAGLRDVAERLLDDNRLRHGEATFYVQVTRGASWPRTHHFPPPDTPPTVYASVARFVPFDELRGRGAPAVTVPDTRWARCDLKTVNLLPNTLAKQRAVEAGVTEALFVRDGVVLEGASTNFVGVARGALRTHPATPAILAGVTREVLLGIARERGIPVDETPVRLDEVHALDEAFLCSTTMDVMPITELDGKPVGSGKPGPVARLLHGELRERLDAGVLAAPR